MELIGYLDSPFVRRVAISMQFLGIEYNHCELSIFTDFDAFRNINPTVKVPTLVLADGQFLIDSNLIIDYLESSVAGRSLMPAGTDDYVAALHHVGIAMVGMEKVAQLIYETSHHPEDRQHQPWVTRIETQLRGAADLMEAAVAASSNSGNGWLIGDSVTQADISTAIAWRFMTHVDRVDLDPAEYPALVQYSARAESLPEFLACPLS